MTILNDLDLQTPVNISREKFPVSFIAVWGITKKVLLKGNNQICECVTTMESVTTKKRATTKECVIN